MQFKLTQQVQNKTFWGISQKKIFMYFVEEYTVNEQNQLVITSLNHRRICLFVGLIPIVIIALDILYDNLGSNAQQALHIRLGDWALRFLCITLFITPLQKITKWRGMSEYRQLFGLYAFFYATLHVIGYVMMDHALVWDVIYVDIIESTYIWFGVFAYTIIFLLAITSSKPAKKMMGKSWKKLHRWIYPASIAALIHYFWQLKGNLFEPVFYSMIILILLAFRLLVWIKDRQLRRLMIPKSTIIDD